MGNSSSRFSRTDLLLGKGVVRRFERSHVAVFGLGAVGSFAVEALTRSGVGALTLIDFDEVRPTNINRQLFALESTLGKPKAEVARKRVLDINPRCQVMAQHVFAGPENLNELLNPVPDAVIDAIDSLNPKTELLKFCVECGIPIVSSMGACDKTDPFCIRVGDISSTSVCPLARRIRKRLKKNGIQKGITCVYGTQKPYGTLGEEGDEEMFVRGRKRTPRGSISYMTGMFGLVAAYEVLRILAGEAFPRPGAHDA
ncbi:MAG: tRNA threonylcarbamoyladenosine dehydratase [Candidatus Omnitrophica bacterium]|nr:tRNA threonylcarbamoyladenosine dehydratase [Candidatus Omnitrophota bacterium]MDD5574728.1 tRNA threonylcarbamoyladenosine dehydratase [Candidatus Omnitrophota bacterium]